MYLYNDFLFSLYDLQIECMTFKFSISPSHLVCNLLIEYLNFKSSVYYQNVFYVQLYDTAFIKLFYLSICFCNCLYVCTNIFYSLTFFTHHSFYFYIYQIVNNYVIFNAYFNLFIFIHHFINKIYII